MPKERTSVLRCFQQIFSWRMLVKNKWRLRSWTLRGLWIPFPNFLHNLLSEKHMHFTHGDLATFRISYMGLPQGSCLSPLLYNFYVNDIDECLANSCTIRQCNLCYRSQSCRFARTIARYLGQFVCLGFTARYRILSGED